MNHSFAVGNTVVVALEQLHDRMDRVRGGGHGSGTLETEAVRLTVVAGREDIVHELAIRLGERIGDHVGSGLQSMRFGIDPVHAVRIVEDEEPEPYFPSARAGHVLLGSPASFRIHLDGFTRGTSSTGFPPPQPARRTESAHANRTETKRWVLFSMA